MRWIVEADGEPVGWVTLEVESREHAIGSVGYTIGERFRGRGYAGYLTRLVAGCIMARGETPFLHTYATNTNAIRLYEALGFVHRTSLWVSVLRRA